MLYTKPMLTILALGILFAILGCGVKTIKHGTEITQEQMARIKDGATTKDDVILMFGAPTKTLNNEKTYVYSWVRGTKAQVLGLGTGTAYGHALVILFDANDVVKAHKVIRDAVDQRIYD
ncbi:MAG TPA: outer membrane protein assembly factor BamE [Proteobacteria bacterium]|nr:outer membrane protein assembly factor BamE [Pseudomonadota bacterium]